ncbi:hypothetical protein AVEN_228475-1 [Araneus ventricosus]|uniref:Uncharacterized protein n=1 Tax=Araneus ventricosus TaxID=182803 RepID=A0A4Y2VCI7_ARAVE|nr:hypothetical protein AVEN_228475-1 [Araneus ventricosus]
MGVASQTVKPYSFYSKSSLRANACSYLDLFTLQYCIRHNRTVISTSSSIVKIGCWQDASRISQSVVQPTMTLHPETAKGPADGAYSLAVRKAFPLHRPYIKCMSQ